MNSESILQGIIEKELGRKILDHAQELVPHWEQILTQKSVQIVADIAKIIQSAEPYPDDQALVEEIMKVLQRNGIDTGLCHEY